MFTKESIKERIVETVNPLDYYRKHFPEWDGKNDTLVHCPRASTHHEGGDDSSASLSINPDTGEFNCFGCGFHGTSVVGYHTDVLCGGNIRKSLATLYRSYIGEVVRPQEIKAFSAALAKLPNVVRSIRRLRGWSEDTIQQYRLGWDRRSKRVTIPIFTAAGFAIDIRRHDSIYKAERKDGSRVTMLATNKGAQGYLYPLRPDITPFGQEYPDLWIVEGEPDCITARQEGINAVTVTGGVRQLLKIPPKYLRAFHGKNIVVCLDNDKPGQSVAKELIESLVAVEPASIKNIVVPDGKDFGEFCTRHGGSGDWMRQVADTAKYIVAPKRKVGAVVPLERTSEAKFIGKALNTDVLVNGKHKAPFTIPRHVEFSCSTIDKCPNCPASGPTGSAEHFIHSDDPNLLLWLKGDPAKLIKQEYGLKSSCPVRATVTEYQNVEQVSLIPALSTSRSDDAGRYCERVGFYLGHGIEANQQYRITATPSVLPRTNESCLVVSKTSSTYDSIDNYHMPDDEVLRLRGLFNKKPAAVLRDVATMMAHNVTKIYDREDLHIAVDLTFHGPSSFSFAGVPLPKGSIELLLFGDTRCGKGQVAEGISRFYDLGKVVSGESASFMGILGGAKKVGGDFQLVWGAIPINNRRLVIVDEFSGLSNQELGRLSRIRSEGIAELNKAGISAHTEANARLIWIANPKKGRPVSDFASGAQGIMDLIGAAEDVARFDLAVVVQKDEVDAALINRQHRQIQSDYTQADLRKVLLWLWSRKSEHIIFTREATDYILRVSNTLAGRYTSSIPLVQGENIRFKVAKLAAAVAGRCFSTSDGQFLTSRGDTR